MHGKLGAVRPVVGAHLARALPSAAQLLLEAGAARAQRVAPHAARAVALLDLRVALAEEDVAHGGDGDVGDGVEGEGGVEGGGEADDSGQHGAGRQLREERAEVADADKVGDAERSGGEELAGLGVGEGRLVRLGLGLGVRARARARARVRVRVGVRVRARVRAVRVGGRVGVGLAGRLLLDEAAFGEERLGRELCRRPPAQRAAHLRDGWLVRGWGCARGVAGWLGGMRHAACGMRHAAAAGEG